MEQQEVLVGAAVPMGLPGRATADEVRASLEAVRLAQESARKRARRETVRTRVWFAAGMGVVALVALGFGPRLARGRHAAKRAVKPAQPAAVVPPLPEPAAPAMKAPPPDMKAAPAAETKPAPAATIPDQGCDTGLMRRAPWRLSPRACAQAFDADPTNAALALAIAHAQHAHGSPVESAQWANRALDLDPKAAEAYVLIARAANRRGRPEEARTAYKRYLELAPRGWHRGEATRATAGAFTR